MRENSRVQFCLCTLETSADKFEFAFHYPVLARVSCTEIEGKIPLLAHQGFIEALWSSYPSLVGV